MKEVQQGQKREGGVLRGVGQGARRWGELSAAIIASVGRHHALLHSTLSPHLAPRAFTLGLGRPACAACAAAPSQPLLLIEVQPFLARRH